MIIKRPEYLNKVIQKMHNGRIKIITGMRRCGKSFLLSNIFKSYLISIGISENQILEYSLEKLSNKKYRNPYNLLDDINNKIKGGNRYYLFIDEVQLIDDFESLLMEFVDKDNIDVYVTGSNSKFLSSDIATEFRGRGDEIKLYPLSFKELYEAKDININELWEEYITYGGLPYIAMLDNPVDKDKYLVDQFNKVYFSDLVDRNKITDFDVLDTVLKLASSSIGSLSNPMRISNTFKSQLNLNISPSRIDRLLGASEEVFLIDKVLRFDIKGRKYINSPFKIYYTDLGIRNAIIKYQQLEESHLMENAVYNELKRRGYIVSIGSVETWSKDKEGRTIRTILEVDFIAAKGNSKFYIQVADNIDSPEKREQEVRPLLSIKDNFKKVLITKNGTLKHFDENGIYHLPLYDFFLDTNSL